MTLDNNSQDIISSDGIEVNTLESTGHLITTGNGDLVLSRCAGSGCSNCKRKIPVQRYKAFMTQWMPLDKVVTIAISEVSK